MKFVSRENIIRVLIEEMGGSPNQIKTTSTLGAVLYSLGTFGLLLFFLALHGGYPGTLSKLEKLHVFKTAL